MNDENELLEPLATEAGQEAIVRAIRDISSLEYAVRAEQAASLASAKAGEASQSAIEASDAEDKAKDWATKTDTYVEQETITIPPAQEGEEPTTETINLYSAKYYAALAQDIYNNMSFDSVPTLNSTNMVNSGVVYSALDLKADKSNTYTKTETDNLINTRLAELVASAPAALDTLQELATALGNDPNFATTIATQLGNKADKSDTYTKTEVDTALSNVQSTLTFDNVPTANSDNPVKSSGIKTALDSKQDTLTFDSTPTANSTNPVTSGGVYTALQNVNIDIDDEITEDSDNPVTSAAIYEALLNFTPSGGGGGAGNASGVVREELWGNTSGWNSSTITLNKSWKDYDILEFVGARPSESPTSSNPYVTENYLTVSQVKTQPIKYLLYNYDNRYMTVSFTSDTVLTAGNNSDFKIYNIYGIKFSKNLSEQMYSNVLYENASGVNSGSIILSDTYDSYDFLEFYYKPSNWGTYFTHCVSVNDIRFSPSILLYGHQDKVMSIVPDSTTQLRFSDVNGFVLYKIVGYKLAKGGYSGIVSDARMTVKCGTVTMDNKITNELTITKTVIFDSPMLDTNYTVQITPSAAEGYAKCRPYIYNKTVNGFDLKIYGDQTVSNNTFMQFDWIAIRPNSYTREGMVEDVLFSNASGVNSGTINLSGNISDYDLISIDVISTENTSAQNTQVYLSSYIQNANTRTITIRYYEDNICWHYGTDSSIIIEDSNKVKITKITGIKFGRYVSGVAVDTTVTLNSNAVITSGAVYDALQNYTPSGGGSGGSITIDSVPTENSQNAVSSGGVYDALLDIEVEQLSTPLYGVITNASDTYLRKTAGELIHTCTAGDRTHYIYKTTASPAIFCMASTKQYNNTRYNWGWICAISSDQNALGITKTNPIPSDSDFNLVEETSGQIYDTETNYNWYYKVYRSGTHPNGTGLYLFNTSTNYSDPVVLVQDFFNLVKPILIADSGSPIKENLFNPTNYTITSGYTITDNTSDKPLKSLIYGFRPIKINGETYYFVKGVNGTFYYENPDNVITIDSSWVVTITPKSSGGGSSITVDSTITQGGTNPVEGGAIYTALGDKADQSTTYTKTEVDTALASKGDVTTNTDQNITGTKTFVGSKKVGFKQSTANDKLGFTLFGNTGTERGYLEFNPTNTIDGVAGLMTLGNYATSAGALTQVGFRRYSNISGASGAYNLLMPMVADARTPFSLTTTYQNFYLPLGFTDGTTTVKTAKSGVVDLSPLLTAAINSITNANGVSY